jgi:hypothetical protein
MDHRHQANACDDEVASLARPPPRPLEPATTTTTTALPRPDFDRAAGPLMDHFFPDGPPPLTLNRLGGDSPDEDAGFIMWPTSSSWNAAGHPRQRGGATTARRSRRVAVTVGDATQSLRRTLELPNEYPAKHHPPKEPTHRPSGNNGTARDDHHPHGECRSYLSGSQASAVAWIACEMFAMVTASQFDDTAPSSTATTTSIRSPLATHDNFRSLLKSIRIGGTNELDSSPRVHQSAILRLVSFLRPIRGGGGGDNSSNRRRKKGDNKQRNGNGNGDSTGSSEVMKSQCAIVQFLHLLSFTQASVANPHSYASSTSHDETHVLFSVLASCCVHEATRSDLRINACRYVYQYLEARHRAGAAAPFRNLRRIAQQVRQRLQLKMTSLRGSSRRRATRKSIDNKDGPEPPVPSDATERLALASVLEAMARTDPRCQDLVLPLPLADCDPNGASQSANATRHQWHEFPVPEWENDFVMARRGWLLPATTPRKRQRSDAMDSPWLRRLKMKGSAAAGDGAANSSSWQRWLGIEDRPSASRRSSCSLLLDMLENRNLHHHVGLSSRRRHGHRQREHGGNVALKRLDTLLPFLLSDYAASIVPPPLPPPDWMGDAGDGRSSRATTADREGVAASMDGISGMTSRMQALLIGIQTFAIHTCELPPAVQDFVETRMLPNWDGTGTIVPTIVSYWFPCSFEELYRRVLRRHIEPLLIYGDSALQYRIITCALTPMVEHWSSKIIESLTEKGEVMSDENGASERSGALLHESQVQSLRDFVRWMDATLVQLFVSSHDDCASNEDLLHLATLRFYDAITKVELRTPALRLNVLPPPQLVYAVMLSASPFILDRLCHLLVACDCLFSGSGKRDRVAAELATGARRQADPMDLVGSYVSDAFAAIVPCDRIFSTQDDKKPSADYSPLFMETVGMRGKTLRRAGGFQASVDFRDDLTESSHATPTFHGTAFAGLIRDFPRHFTVNEGDETVHEGMQHNSVENRYLDYLRKRGFTGIQLLSSLAYREQNGKASD